MGQKKIGQKIEDHLLGFACWVLTLDLTIGDWFYTRKRRRQIKRETRNESKG